MMSYTMNQGYEAAVQIDGKVYDLQTLTSTTVMNKAASPILFYTRVKSTNSPILIEATLQDSVKSMKLYSIRISLSLCLT